MNEFEILNNTETENKIINFYSLYNIELEFVKKIDSFSIIRYFFIIKNNSRINKINSLINELQLAINTDKIKLDFEQKSGCIIFECSKRQRKVLYFEELENKTTEGLTASIGKDLNNKEIELNLLETPHLLVAGSTGSGKSCILNNIISSLALKYNKEYYKTVLIDIKQVEFLQFANIPQLATPIITTTEKSIDVLNKMCVIMMHRYNTLSQNSCRNIQEYNEKSNDKMCYYSIVIDELADLFIQSPDIETIICRLAQLGRAAGIHLILATQRPDRETITGRLKVNIPSRLALTVSSVYDSRIILDQTGAEKLTGKGDFILKTANGEQIRGQGALIRNISELLRGVKNE